MAGPISMNESIYYVDSDNVGGGRAATQLLIDRGATRIATITGPRDMTAGLDRLAGYTEALVGGWPKAAQETHRHGRLLDRAGRRRR